jgi:hypothetical protein
VMVTSLSSYSVVIHFALTIEKQEQQQPILLQSTTSKHGHWTCFIQTPQLKFPTGNVCFHWSGCKLIYVYCSET